MLSGLNLAPIVPVLRTDGCGALRRLVSSLAEPTAHAPERRTGTFASFVQLCTARTSSADGRTPDTGLMCCRETLGSGPSNH